MQFDPQHTVLPWAGIRLVLQMALTDVEKFGFIVEGCTELTYLINYFCLLEATYLKDSHQPSHDMKTTLIRVYALILEYRKAKSFFATKTATRKLGSVLVGPADLMDLLSKIQGFTSIVDQYARLIGAENHVLLQSRMKQLYEKIDNDTRITKSFLEDLKAPLQRVDDTMAIMSTRLEASERIEVLR